jgi:hypothetical protein
MDQDLQGNRKKSRLVLTKHMGFSIKVVPEGDGMKVVLVLFLQVKLSFTCLVPRDVNQAWPG